MRHPKKQSNGFIDEDEVFTFIVGTLKRPISDLNDMEIRHYLLLWNNFHKNEKRHYEILELTHRIAIHNAMNGKNEKLFGDENQNDNVEENQKKSKEEHEKEIEKLNKIFG